MRFSNIWRNQLLIWQKETFENLEIEGGSQGVKSFLENQFELRLGKFTCSKKKAVFIT